MKKILAILLALMMVLVSAAVLAEDAEPDIAHDQETVPATFTLTKTYTVTGEKAVNPSDTVKFTVRAGDPAFENDGTAAPDPLPMITIDENGFAVAQGAASVDVTVGLPTYTVAGIYNYIIEEVDTNVAGVTYLADPLNVKVTVVNGATSGTFVVEGIAVRQGDAKKKTDNFENKYDSGTLEISKTVTGNLGDKAKVWNFTVKLTAPTGDTVNAPITVEGDYTSFKEGETDVPATGIAAGWTGEKSLSLQLVHGQNIKLFNLPAGVTYTVTETEANADGYTTTETFSDTEKKIAAGDADTAAFENNKAIDVDTGVALDSAVYMLIMVLALAGIVTLKVRRREEN